MTKLIEPTPTLAHAAGWDAGNRSMREAGRTEWNEDDWNEAARIYTKILPEPTQ